MRAGRVSGVLIKDGAMGTLLEAWGVDYDKVGPMWSSSVLLSDRSLVERVHRAYIEAGCDVLLTCTYQMYEEGCAASNVTMSELVNRAVEAARHFMPPSNRKETRGESTAGESRASMTEILASALSAARGNRQDRVVLLAGSLGPYGSSLPGGKEYSGDYSIHDAVINTFHGRRLEAFLDKVGERRVLKVDFLLLETFPRLDEALGILAFVHQHEILRDVPMCFSFVAAPVESLLSDTADDRELDEWWNAATSAVRLVDGNTFVGALDELRKNRGTTLAGVGCNCAAPLEVSLVAGALLQTKRQETEEPLVLLLYPNSGETYAERQWIKSPHMARTPEVEKPSVQDLRKRLAHGGGDAETCARFVLQLLQQRPEAPDWLFEVVIYGACCRSAPEDISAIRQTTSEYFSLRV
ncbi:homocysteine S-methyltransferase [Trypanosoma rangeli]|uniref:Homocysteine S-methyltransferase n=1 Tax=Trypanosoma rangeli TaxID=5698 RepID=A0A422NJL4_TRYRA|nr:homocysteine S-methyltransferase [Trypanosoma rangeli]RNF05688.1 homocysteine S-methyltransferase [Trypanosoma rangeli]|eukprot:RNF05688.1 homocysteine S-methyltransferase [Trypanosoma rangeli]